MSEKHDPWHYAEKAGRDYLTPEDVGDAYKHGAATIDIYATVLDAIGRKAVEDVSCTAFVAVDIPKRPRRRATPKRSTTT